jgi:hypothetical protein
LGHRRTSLPSADAIGEIVQAGKTAHILEHAGAAQVDPSVGVLGSLSLDPGPVRPALGFVDLTRQGEKIGGFLADLGDMGTQVNRLFEARFPQEAGQIHRLEALSGELAATLDGGRVTDVYGLQAEVSHVGIHILGQDQTP